METATLLPGVRPISVFVSRINLSTMAEVVWDYVRKASRQSQSLQANDELTFWSKKEYGECCAGSQTVIASSIRCFSRIGPKVE